MSRYQTRSQSRLTETREKHDTRESREKPSTIRYPTRFQKRVAGNPTAYDNWKWIQRTFVKQTHRIIKEVIGIRTYLKKMWTIWCRSTKNQSEFHCMINAELTQFQKKYSYYIPMLKSAKDFFHANVSNRILITQTSQQLTESVRVLNKFKKVFGVKYDEI